MLASLEDITSLQILSIFSFIYITDFWLLVFISHILAVICIISSLENCSNYLTWSPIFSTTATSVTFFTVPLQELTKRLFPQCSITGQLGFQCLSTPSKSYFIFPLSTVQPHFPPSRHRHCGSFISLLSVLLICRAFFL